MSGSEKQEAPKQPEAKAEAKAPEVKQPEAKASRYAFSVAEGHSVTSKKGLLAAGAEVKADWLGGGQKALDALVQKAIVKKA